MDIIHSAHTHIITYYTHACVRLLVNGVSEGLAQEWNERCPDKDVEQNSKGNRQEHTTS